MRYWIALAAVLSLAGCKTLGEVAADADDAKCRSYGAQKGAPDYTQCRATLEASRRNAAATASVADAVSRPNIWQSTDPGWLHRPY